MVEPPLLRKAKRNGRDRDRRGELLAKSSMTRRSKHASRASLVQYWADRSRETTK